MDECAVYLMCQAPTKGQPKSDPWGGFRRLLYRLRERMGPGESTGQARSEIPDPDCHPSTATFGRYEDAAVTCRSGILAGIVDQIDKDLLYGCHIDKE